MNTTYDVTVKLTETDGNAFAIINRVGMALRADVGRDAENEYRERCHDLESYDALLAYTMATVEVV